MNCGSYTGHRGGGKRSLEAALSGRYVQVMEGNSGISCLVMDDDATLRGALARSLRALGSARSPRPPLPREVSGAAVFVGRIA